MRGIGTRKGCFKGVMGRGRARKGREGALLNSIFIKRVKKEPRKSEPGRGGPMSPCVIVPLIGRPVTPS